MLNLTPTHAALLERGLAYLIAHPDHVLESDLHRVVWMLAQMATQAAAEANNLAAMQTASDLATAANPPPEYLTLAQASRLYGVPVSTLRYHASRGSFDAIKSDKRTWLADSHSLATWARKEQVE